MLVPVLLHMLDLIILFLFLLFVRVRALAVFFLVPVLNFMLVLMRLRLRMTCYVVPVLIFVLVLLRLRLRTTCYVFVRASGLSAGGTSPREREGSAQATDPVPSRIPPERPGALVD